ncbi:cytokine receptor common subunit beta [Hypanus sabinus]|uniref:cytokine receptor common subunit beta n=1 Tax=Hypanus sabinus TaxID=79690 RepID=UPI0028C42E8B|nr:cytokine receptor common subunit beta [Hypanus sabinus]XP_059809421.1 cytokine receptor common subunit beta [Hypanus sabinus]
MFSRGRPVFEWTLFSLVFILGRRATEGQNISSLRCYTDYVSRIDCQWTEDATANCCVPMDLYYQKSSALMNHSLTLCNRTETFRGISGTESRCSIKEKYFAIAFEFTFTFKPRKPVGLNKSFQLMENIKLQPPFNLTVAGLSSGGYRLSWETVYAGNSSSKRLGMLQYEVSYKRTWEPWETSVSKTITGNDNQLAIKSTALIADSTYVARVRVRQLNSIYGDRWSVWSSLIQWDVARNEAEPRTDKAEMMPRNLQCSYDGIQQIECTWEMLKESSKYFKFNLHYRMDNGSEKQACQVSEIVHVYPHLTVHRCNITVPDQEGLENYEVFLKLVKQSMRYKPSKNIKPIAPFNLKSEELNDGRFQLEWNSTNAYKLNYEINYKKKNASWKGSEVKSIPQNTRSFTLPKHSLEPSSHYVVRVRAKVDCIPKEPDCYEGPWSDWSSTTQIITGPDKEIPIIVACSLIALFFIVAPIVFFQVKRKKRLWLESIPDPAKSKLFHLGTQPSPLRPVAAVETVTLEEGNICKVVAAESTAASPQVIPRVKVESPLKEEKQDHSSSPVTSHSSKQAEMYQGLSPEMGTSAAECSDPQASQTEPANYNGPYLFNFQDISSIMSILTEIKTATSKNANYFRRGQDAPAYVKLPSGGAVATDQSDAKPDPSGPSNAYVLNFPIASKTPNYYLHALPGEKPVQPPHSSTASCVAFASPANSAHTPPPEAATDNAQAKGTVSGVASLQETSSSHGPVCKDSAPEDKKAQDASPVSQDHPAAAPWPATCSGYVLSPPGEESHVKTAPTLPTATELKVQSLLADPQPGLGYHPPTRTMDTGHSLEGNSLPKHQTDLQKLPSKERGQSLADVENSEAPEVILYQQGAKPIHFQQIGDYCFLPGSCPSKTNEITKVNFPPSPTNQKHAKECWDLSPHQPEQFLSHGRGNCV